MRVTQFKNRFVLAGQSGETLKVSFFFVFFLVLCFVFLWFFVCLLGFWVFFFLYQQALENGSAVAQAIL